MIASVAAEDPDGGVDRQRGQFAQLLHARVALLAIAQGFVLIRRIRRNICVVRRHAGRPVFNRPCRTLDSVAVSLDTAAEPGRTTAGYCSFSPSSLPIDRLMITSKLRPGGESTHSSTSRIRKTGFLDSSKSSICHSAFSWSLREMPPTISPQTLVNSFHAASRSASSVP